MAYGEDSQNERRVANVSGDERFLAETIAGSSGKDTAREQEGSVPVTKQKDWSLSDRKGSWNRCDGCRLSSPR